MAWVRWLKDGPVSKSYGAVVDQLSELVRKEHVCGCNQNSHRVRAVQNDQ